jgi:hypothetical protein
MLVLICKRYRYISSLVKLSAIITLIGENGYVLVYYKAISYPLHFPDGPAL